MKSLFIALLIFAVSFIFLTGVALADGSADAEAIAYAGSDLTMQGSKIPMGIIGQDLKFPQLIPYFGPDNPGFRFRPLADILLYGNVFTIASLQANVSDKMMESNGLVRVTSTEALKQVVTVIYTGNGKNIADERYQRRGYIMAKAAEDFTSLDALMLTLLIANKMGSNTVHITRQGVDFSMYATGWGVGLGGVSGSLNATQDGGQVATGMLGYSSGKSGANKDPWIQGIALEPLP